ncbi:MAG: glycoside hydrolase family 3 C-terminal domain-containing protein, partial [Bacteroidota bacterium]|nr:glycoside hydrolase family 3 C-terminal domain-containing protein [Bacteroidota bacterium]
MKRISFFIVVSLFTMQLFGQSGGKAPQLGKDKIKDVIAAMTPEEKVDLLIGVGGAINSEPEGEKNVVVNGAAGRTWGIPRLGITSAVLCDGPAGLRINPTRKDATQTYYCTAFPTATALATTWNPQVVENIGKAMGNEVLEYGSDVLLAPAMNIHRNPLCGRNFEYYSEDPLLSGKMGAAMVRGLQSNGVGTSVKHFVANNQETNRTKVNEIVSQRALREIYLRGFEIAVKESQPWTIMSSYNKLNGFYTSENHDLITTILRNEWGFKGMVMTDWGGGADAVAQMKAGNDLIQPGNHQRAELLEALKNKTIDEKVLDRNLERILDFIMKTPRFKGYAFTNHPDLKAHLEAAREAACEGMVLLKNGNNSLPFKKVKNVALFGKTSYRFIVGGTGSGRVNYESAASIKDEFVNAGYKVVKPLEDIYTDFVKEVMSNTKGDKLNAVDFHSELPLSKDQITAQVKSSDVAVITIGRNAGEGRDRDAKDFDLSETEVNLIKDVCEAYHAAGKKVIVVLNIGGVISTADWGKSADAIVLSWQTGQKGASALVDILKGKVNPSGKLPMSFPLAYQDVPSSKTFAGEPKDNPINSFYNEGIYVGYRYYETFKVPTAYEFGYGLSYTNFKYSDLTLSSNTFSDSLTVKVTVKNTGKVAGKEVAELYLSAPRTEIQKPEEELKGFAKTKLLKPGESQELTFS